MGSAEILDNFKLLSNLTAQMRALVAQGKWDELIALEQRCRELVEHMKADDGRTKIDESSRKEVVHLIRKSLEDDAEIRTQTRRRLSELEKLMQSDQQRQRLNKAYG